ncbi:hypothetical protein DNL40_13095 [Xylanimonas oleitrophica]|uniref:RNA polymerase sigma-70 region 2 domain-containing protein n=1 Tax=Xylanimonas oleitrophica TaxID=2607479 RepID=A0A2W5Y342_9MICO|nr:hypothetical protein DNL40_13095 [Xylanimonas oleitrophica]
MGPFVVATSLRRSPSEPERSALRGLLARNAAPSSGHGTVVRHALFDSTHRALLAYTVRRVTDPADAADVVVETFLVAWHRLDDLPVGADARPWLFGVARRVLSNFHRGERRRIAPRGQGPSATPSRSTRRTLVSWTGCARASPSSACRWPTLVPWPMACWTSWSSSRSRRRRSWTRRRTAPGST